MTDERKCENCVYWLFEHDNEFDSQGICKRYPPVVVWADGQFATAWPDTSSGASCGEFQAREDAPT